MFQAMFTWLAEGLQWLIVGMPAFWEFANQTLITLPDGTAITPLSMFTIGGLTAIIAYKVIRFLIV